MANLTPIALLCKIPKWTVRIILNVLHHLRSVWSSESESLGLFSAMFSMLCIFYAIITRNIVVFGLLLSIGVYIIQDHTLLFPMRFVQHMDDDCHRMTILPTEQGILHARNGSFPILFFHGQGGTAGLFEGHYSDLAKSAGASAWIGEYRGYGCCHGWIGPEGLCADARKMLLYVAHKTGSKVIVHGGSMGAAAAACLLRDEYLRSFLAGLILEDPWTTWPDAVKNHWLRKLVPSWVPLERLLMSQYDTLSAVMENGTMPLLILSSKDDQLLPHSMKEDIFDFAPSIEKWFVAEPGEHGTVLASKKAREKYAQFCRMVMNT